MMHENVCFNWYGQFIVAGDRSSSSGDERVGEILGGEPSSDIRGEHRVERTLRKGILSLVYRCDIVNNSKCATKMAVHFVTKEWDPVSLYKSLKIMQQNLMHCTSCMMHAWECLF